MKQTYEEAVLKTVMWWAEKIQQPLNQNNGDDSRNGGMMFMLMNTVSNNAQQSITPDKIKIFQESLTEKLIAVKNDKYRRTDLDVDYHPNRMLSECAEKANIDLSVFPCKTWTRIDLENQVEVSMGYGTVPSVI